MPQNKTPKTGGDGGEGGGRRGGGCFEGIFESKRK